MSRDTGKVDEGIRVWRYFAQEGKGGDNGRDRRDEYIEMNTSKGKAIYQKRKETVEPTFGIIKQAMGFRQFLSRGLGKVNLEWETVCLGYNMKRLFRLSQG